MSLPETIPMQRDMLPRVLEIEKASFSDPWTEAMFLSELGPDPGKVALVIESEGELGGYLIGWLVFEEFHLGNIAVDSKHRRKGLAKQLLRSAFDLARKAGCSKATLEVRVSNMGALTLYRRFGFKEAAIRKKYYGNEDALVMIADIAER